MRVARQETLAKACRCVKGVLWGERGDRAFVRYVFSVSWRIDLLCHLSNFSNSLAVMFSSIAPMTVLLMPTLKCD